MSHNSYYISCIKYLDQCNTFSGTVPTSLLLFDLDHRRLSNGSDKSRIVFPLIMNQKMINNGTVQVLRPMWLINQWHSKGINIHGLRILSTLLVYFCFFFDRLFLKANFRSALCKTKSLYLCPTWRNWKFLKSMKIKILVQVQGIKQK